MILGYCRAGLFGRSADLKDQRSGLAAIGAQRFFSERTGLFGRKPELERAIAAARKGDVIVVTKPYLVAHSTKGILAFMSRLGRNGIGFRVIGTSIDTSTTTGRMILGSTPPWSLGISPLGSLLFELGLPFRSGRNRPRAHDPHPSGAAAGTRRTGA